MGKLICSRCFAEAEADSQEEADALIDHARGQMIGRPCSGKQSDLVWEGASTPAKQEEIIATETITTESDSPTKPKKSKRR